MKITLNLHDGSLVAFEKAFARTGLTNDAAWRRSFAHQLLAMAAESFAASDQQPCIGPVGCFDFRLWTEEERRAHYAMHAAARLHEEAPKG